jgi:hypothetical protein
MNRRRLALWFLAAFALSAWAPAAHASPTFPGIVQTKLDTPCAPPCIVCHATSFGGIGTAVTPFGQAVHELGAHGGNPDGLRHALDVLEHTQAVTELREGRNPNDGTAICALEYGCTVRAPERRSDALVPVVLLIGLGFRVLARSCRGRSSGRRRA